MSPGEEHRIIDYIAQRLDRAEAENTAQHAEVNRRLGGLEAVQAAMSQTQRDQAATLEDLARRIDGVESQDTADEARAAGITAERNRARRVRGAALGLVVGAATVAGIVVAAVFQILDHA